jgi:hypothetical protein
MHIRQVGLQTSPGRIWCSVGKVAKTLPIIGDDLWETRAIHTTTQVRMREGKPPVGPQSKGLVNKNLRKIVAKHFEELALRPTTPLPLSDLNLPESDEDEVDVVEVGGFNPWDARANVVTSAAPFAPSKHESISRTTEAAGAADASTRATAALTTSRTSTATTDEIRDTTNASGDFPSITESVAMGATQKRRGNIKGHEKGRFRKGDGKPDDWTEWIMENKPNELEALEKRRSARLGGKGQFRKDEGKPHDWTAWEKEYQAAELEASETRRSATSGGTSHSAQTRFSATSTHTPVIQQHHIAPVVVTTSIPLPTAAGVTLSDFTMSVNAKIQDVAKPDDDQQTRDERRTEENYMSEEVRIRKIVDGAQNDSQWEDYLAQETAPERPQVGDRVCVVCQRHRSNAHWRCECNEGQYWTIPERAWIEAVARLKGVTTLQGHVRSGPRSGLPTGSPLSNEEEAEMPRNYTREQEAKWELNDYVEEMTSLLRVKLMERRRDEEAARSARGDHNVQMSRIHDRRTRNYTIPRYHLRRRTYSIGEFAR